MTFQLEFTFIRSIGIHFIGLLWITGQIINAEVPYDENRFEAQVLDMGMPRPLELDVSKDGRVFFIELAGKLKIYDPQKNEVSLAGELEVFEGQENGLIGLTLDPEFSTNHWIYLMYSPKEKYVGQFVSRFVMQGNKLDLESEKVVIKIPTHRDECCHHAGSLEFGPHGHLFIATGDNTHPGGDSQGYAPIDEREGRHAYDASDTSGNTMDLRGKILRIKPMPDGSYIIPPGNLFSPGGAIQGLPEIYVMGCRNPWRMNVDQKTGFVYWGEVGPDARNDGPKGPMGYDEINQARQAGFFGWPFFIANNRPYYDFNYATGKVGELYNPQNPINNSTTNTGSKQLPIPTPAWIYYPYGNSKEFPQVGSGGRTACAGPVYHFQENLNSQTKLPRYLDNCLFIFDWQRKFIKYVRLDENSDIVSIEPFLTEIDINRAVDMKIGPDGALYVLDYGDTWGNNEDSKLLRIEYLRENRPPISSLEISTNVGKAPLSVNLSASKSTDKDKADKLTYKWYVDQKLLATTIKDDIQFTFDKIGKYNVGVVVNDGTIDSQRSSLEVFVGNDAPKVLITSPNHGGFFKWGDNIEYVMMVRDHEDGSSFKDPESLGRRAIWNTLLAPASPNNVESHISNGLSHQAGLARIQNSDCLNCHAIDRKLVGPSFQEIASKYKGQKEAVSNSAKRIIQGSSNVWGEIPMLPHAQFSQSQAEEMVRWIFSLNKMNDSSKAVQALTGSIKLKPNKSWGAQAGGSLVLKASYTDLGGSGMPNITRSHEVMLRNERVEAEHFSTKNGMAPLNNDDASGGAFMGSIHSGHYLVFKDVLLEDIQKVKIRVASPEVGGRVVLRSGGLKGPLLGYVDFKPTGAWDQWIIKDFALNHQNNLVDVYCITLSPKGGGPFMNIDYLEFKKN